MAESVRPSAEASSVGATVKVVLAALLTVISVAAVAVAPAAAQAGGSTIVVNSASDREDSNTGDDICRTSAGDCTLRAAIQTANAQSGPNRIEFAIPGSGVRRIDVGSELPAVYDPSGGTTIDGYTQSDARPNTAATGSNARIRIELRGRSAWGLRLTSAENVVKGMAIAGFRSNIAIHYEAADGNVLAGNFIGPDASGNFVAGSSRGVHIWLGPDQNTVGGPNLADRNVISGNSLQGLLIEQGNTSRNVIQNNVIGLNPALSDRLTQRTGLDIQWGTWGNLVGGVNAGEGNLISGNLQSAESNWGGIDMSHSSAGNLILGNYIGTLGDGNTATSYSRNTHGILMKDDAKNNFIADNVIANSQWDGIKMRHNFTGASTWVNNRVGVGSRGASLPNLRNGVRLNGHDDLLHDNIIANNIQGGVVIVDETFNDANTNHPPQQTLGNVLRYNTFYRNGGPQVDIAPVGQDADDQGDGDDGPHRRLNRPVFTGAGQGQIYGTACAGCEVQIYVSGVIRSDGTVDTSSANGQIGAGWMGTAAVDESGRFSLADNRMQVGRKVWALAVDAEGNTSEWTAGGIDIPSTPYGIAGNPSSSLAKTPRPTTPALPPPYVPVQRSFDCSHEPGTLSWTDAGAAAYYMFATTDGTERYLGPKTGTSASVTSADSYRVTHWGLGRATTARCDGAAPAAFSCSVSNGILSWTVAGASNYYVFATTGGTSTYLGGHAGTTLNVQPADSYRVTHWATGSATRATCVGDGGQAFACSVSNGVLSWTDVGASNYYVFAVNGGANTYLGGHSGTTLNVAAADSYRVTYWSGGSPIRANCS